MNIFATITNRTTIIGVILATAMISAVITLGISLQRYMYDYAVETDGNWHVVAKGLSEEQVKEFQENEEVKDSSVISEIGYAKIGENDEDLFGQYLYLQSIDEKAAEMLSVKLTQGRLPENENEIIIQGGLQQNDNEIRIGDTISFPVGDRKDAEGNSLPFNAYIQVDEEGNPMETFQEREQRQFEVVGFLEHWGDTQVAGAGLDAFIGKGEESQSVNQIYMELKNPSDAFAFMEKYEDEFSMQGNTSVLRWMGVSGNASFEGMLNGMLTILSTMRFLFRLENGRRSLACYPPLEQRSVSCADPCGRRHWLWEQSEFRSGFSAESEESELLCTLSEIPWRSLSMVHRVER